MTNLVQKVNSGRDKLLGTLEGDQQQISEQSGIITEDATKEAALVTQRERSAKIKLKIKKTCFEN